MKFLLPAFLLPTFLFSFFIPSVAFAELQSLCLSQNHMKYYGCWRFELHLDKGQYLVSADFSKETGERQKIEKKVAPLALVKELKEILEKYKIHTWKSVYRKPSHRILDETTWLFSVSFTDGREIAAGKRYEVSGGDKMEARQELLACFKKHLS